MPQFFEKYRSIGDARGDQQEPSRRSSNRPSKLTPPQGPTATVEEETDRIVSTAQAASHLGVSTDTVKRAIRAGRLQASQPSGPGTPYALRESWLDDYIDGCLVGPANSTARMVNEIPIGRRRTSGLRSMLKKDSG